MSKQRMKEIYQDANIGPTSDVKFKTTSHVAPKIRKVIHVGGWTLVPDNQLKQVWAHINYTLCTYCMQYSYTFGCVSM